MPEFLEVRLDGTLRGFDAERRVAARAAGAGHVIVRRFTASGKAKKALAVSSARAMTAGIHAVIGNDREAILFEGSAECAGRIRGLRSGQRNRRRYDRKLIVHRLIIAAVSACGR